MARVRTISLSLFLLASFVALASGNIRLSATQSGTMVASGRVSDPDDPSRYQISPALYFTRDPQDLIRRGFAFFDLVSITEPVTGATLRLHVDDLAHFAPGPGVFGISFYDVVEPPDASRHDKFEDLGSGKSYGSASIGESAIGTTVDVDLSQAALDDINAVIESDSDSDRFGIGFPRIWEPLHVEPAAVESRAGT